MKYFKKKDKVEKLQTLDSCDMCSERSSARYYLLKSWMLPITTASPTYRSEVCWLLVFQYAANGPSEEVLLAHDISTQRKSETREAIMHSWRPQQISEWNLSRKASGPAVSPLQLA